MAKEAAQGNSSASKSLMWMMIALFVGLALLLAGGLFVASRVVRSMGLAATTAKDTIHTPGGTFRLEKENEVGPGLPIYPRAALIVPDENDAAAAIKQAQNGVEKSLYHTTDMRDYVDTWYKEHLSPEYTRHDPGDKPSADLLGGATVTDDDVCFVAERNQKVRIVMLSLDTGGTKISLIRFDKSSPGDDSAPATDQPAPAQQAPAK